MTSQKDLKRLVRSRMQKTGESYTAARANIVQKVSPSKPDPSQYPRIAGISDAKMTEKTGCTWEKWVFVLDHSKAYDKPHRDIAKHILDRYDVTGWWAQTITVGYERIKGLRDKGQRRGGGYDCNKSRTFNVPVSRLYSMFAHKRHRSKWLVDDLTIRTSHRDRTIRMLWNDGTAVDMAFTDKGSNKSTVTIQHRKHKTKAQMEKRRTFWTDRLKELATIL